MEIEQATELARRYADHTPRNVRDRAGRERTRRSPVGLCTRRYSPRGTRYRHCMAREAEANSGHAIARLADSGEDAMRNLAALPLRMLAGALGIFEALLRTAADGVSEGDQIDERVVDLERRVDSLEEQATGRREGSSAAGAARKRTSTGVDTAAEQRGA
jgi:hypothetical protein